MRCVLGAQVGSIRRCLASSAAEAIGEGARRTRKCSIRMSLVLNVLSTDIWLRANALQEGKSESQPQSLDDGCARRLNRPEQRTDALSPTRVNNQLPGSGGVQQNGCFADWLLGEYRPQTVSCDVSRLMSIPARNPDLWPTYSSLPICSNSRRKSQKLLMQRLIANSLSLMALRSPGGTTTLR